MQSHSQKTEYMLNPTPFIWGRGFVYMGIRKE